jgi:hypothetical protein
MLRLLPGAGIERRTTGIQIVERLSGGHGEGDYICGFRNTDITRRRVSCGVMKHGFRQRFPWRLPSLGGPSTSPRCSGSLRLMVQMKA